MYIWYKSSLIIIFSLTILVFILLFSISAPYGKFSRKGWGPLIKSKWAWMIMELPSPFLMTLFFLSSSRNNLPQNIFIFLWLAHYLHRTFIYPFTQSGGEKPYPYILVAMAFIFNCLNGFVNGYCIFHFKNYSLTWLYSWQFITGIIMFVTGYVINKIADERLRNLRLKNSGEYVIPEGLLFSHISSPHYLGEIIEWAGWAVLTWSVSGLAFFVFTFANLFPRAISAHRWYKSHFPEYPGNRKAIIPFII